MFKLVKSRKFSSIKGFDKDIHHLFYLKYKYNTTKFHLQYNFHMFVLVKIIGRTFLRWFY